MIVRAMGDMEMNDSVVVCGDEDIHVEQSVVRLTESARLEPVRGDAVEKKYTINSKMSCWPNPGRKGGGSVNVKGTGTRTLSTSMFCNSCCNVDGCTFCLFLALTMRRIWMKAFR